MAYARRILIDKRDYSDLVNTCSFDWIRDGGCNVATLVDVSAPFDSYDDIEIGDLVEIRYGINASTRWWHGFVAGLQTDVNNGLTINCVGTKVKLGEVFPLGRYGGSKVDLSTPTGFTYLVSEVGGQLAAGNYTYRVSSIDDLGETLTTSTVLATVVGNTGQVTLSWTKVDNATGYRVYKGTANPYVYWQTSEVTFVDDGTSSGTTTTTLPSSDTATAPTIASAFVNDVLTDLLTTYNPDGVGVGNIAAGSAFELDDYDLGDGEASLLDVLSTLSDIVGDTVWGVDENGDVYFVPEGTAVTRTYYIGKEGLTADVIGSATRERSRDGITAVRVVGTDSLNDPVRETEVDANVGDTDDWPSAKSVAGSAYLRTINRAFGSNVTATTGYLTEALTQLTDAYASVSAQVALVPELAALKRVALKWNGAAYEPNPPYTEAIIVAELARINNRIRSVRNLRYSSKAQFENYSRRKVVSKYLPGIKTPQLARIAASNFTAKYTPVPDRWNVTVEGLTDLIKPGIDLVRIVTEAGDRYELIVQAASYDFSDTVICSLTLGDPVYDEEEEIEDVKKTTQRLASRAVGTNIYVPYLPST